MPETNLKVALLAHDTVVGNIVANLRIVDDTIAGLTPDTDLVILPEMFNTPFTTDSSVLEQTAEPNDGSTITTLQRISDNKGIAICGTFTARENNLYFNRGFFIRPEEPPVFYDKRHLFSAGGESEILTRGATYAPIIEFKSWHFKMAICYDLRFPAWNRAKANNYDALIVPANWPHSRAYAWRHLLIARAIENQAYVLGCNRSGEDLYGSYTTDDTLAFDHWGKEISLRTDSNPSVVYATLEHEKLINARTKFRPWRDADEFSIELS